MPTLNLGVMDIPYAGHVAAPSFVDDPDAFHKEFGDVTTGDVATRLEEHYGVMDGFVRMHMTDIETVLTQSVNAAMESMIAGAPGTIDIYGDGLGEIEKLFKLDYLALMEAESAGLSGTVPTKAALEGRSVRFKSGRGPRRPSFIDSGLYQSSFKAWVD